MDEFEVQCNECDWQGYAIDLVSKTEDLDDKDFNYCPDCGSNDIECTITEIIKNVTV